MSKNTDIDCMLIHNFFFLTLIQYLNVALINMVTILMMSPKLATLDVLQIKLL